MPESARQDLPAPRPDEPLALPVTDEQDLVLRRAAALVGWTVPQYVLCAALDRAERDIHEHASQDAPPHTHTTTEPFLAFVLPVD
ncbi:type II toxin -antitoxin system TacA 1-like antitoxin [Actinomadura parmotrematis]|uniref:DUF1778 domain-containing protein n=1 Tax=Actinomadura parmotrematis TaxID=2864039 RepID=A0ABS7G2Z3_9ACTN|nr:DUF1778 domain-containing protein [Actinomadura parmotrematis]MBW8486008.1 DUF1778 domain-containing protein [Actinomadura parmotrematis]